MPTPFSTNWTPFSMNDQIEVYKVGYMEGFIVVNGERSRIDYKRTKPLKGYVFDFEENNLYKLVPQSFTIHTEAEVSNEKIKNALEVYHKESEVARKNLLDRFPIAKTEP